MIAAQPSPSAMRVFVAALVALGVGWPAVTPAQPDDRSLDPPAYVAAIDGGASFIRGGEVDDLTLNLPLVDGDRVRTDAGARAELHWPGGDRLWLDEGTTLDLVSTGLVRLVEGRVRFRASESPGAAWRIETAAGTVREVSPPDVIVAVVDTAAQRIVDVAVITGAVRLATAQGDVPIGRGQRATADTFGDLPVAESWDLGWRDEFLAWADTRVDEDRPVASANYLPDTLQHFSGTLERHGRWEVEPTYGHVWYPVVAPGWAPYTGGNWRRVGFYGSVWVGADPWAWPTHHYGRWGIDGFGRWYWIPAARWSPGWVSWVVGPGYVGWAPLGYYDRPVVVWGSWGTWGSVGPRPRPYAPWHGWTVVPSNRFWSRGRVSQYSVDIGRLPAHERGAFVTQRSAPAPGRGSLSRSGIAALDGPRDASGRQRVPPTTTRRTSDMSPERVNRGTRVNEGVTRPTRVLRQGDAVSGETTRRDAAARRGMDAPRRNVTPESDNAPTRVVPRRERVDAPPQSPRRATPDRASPDSSPWRERSTPRAERPSEPRRGAPTAQPPSARGEGAGMARPPAARGGGQATSRPPASRGGDGTRSDRGATRRPSPR